MSSSEDNQSKNNDAVTFGGFIEECGLLKHGFICVCFHLLYFVLPVSIATVPVLCLVYGNTWLKIGSSLFLVAYASTFDGCHKKAGCPRTMLVNNPVIRWIFEWLPMRMHRTTKLDPSNRYVFACHPHGAFAFNRGLVGFCTDVFWEAAFPGIKFRVLTATAAFYVPWIREMWLWSYCVDASKKTAVYVMEKLGCSIFVYPGGEREQMETQRGRHILYLLNRKGFVKLAMQQGALLVPVYSFGECNLYHHFQIGIGFRKWLVKRFGVAIPLVCGQLGLLPYRTPVTMVFGAPINVGKIAEPSEEELNAAHAKYVAALSKLFDDHKKRLGYGDATLEII